LISVTSSHPDLDCVFVNSGIQRRSVFSEPESIDINQIQDEMTVKGPPWLVHSFPSYI
jgi:short-subunit dehydrogenase involved in D-alanine esterification of teichoic acids